MRAIYHYFPLSTNTAILGVLTGSFISGMLCDSWTTTNLALTTLRQQALRYGISSCISQYANELIIALAETAQNSNKTQTTLQAARLSVFTGSLILLHGAHHILNIFTSDTSPQLGDNAQLAYGVATTSAIFHQIYLGSQMIGYGSRLVEDI